MACKLLATLDLFCHSFICLLIKSYYSYNSFLWRDEIYHGRKCGSDHVVLCLCLFHALVLSCVVLCNVCTSTGHFIVTASYEFVGYMSLCRSPFPQCVLYKSAGEDVSSCLWFRRHTCMDQGLGECMCWWKSNVLCLQGTACFSLSLLQLQTLSSIPTWDLSS